MSTESVETNSRAYWLLAGAIVLEIIATLSLKGALTAPWLYAVVVGGYIGAFVMLDQVLRAGMKVGVAWGIWGAVGVAGTAVFSHFLFGEPLNAQMLLGIAILIAGVLCIELGGKTK